MLVLGSVIPFSARNIRIARGLGPKASYSCIVGYLAEVDFGRDYTTGRRESGNPNCGACCAVSKRSYRNLLMRFCPQCGAPLLAGAKFCVECGRALDAAASGAGEAAGAPRGRNTITTAFVFVF